MFGGKKIKELEEKVANLETSLRLKTEQYQEVWGLLQLRQDEILQLKANNPVAEEPEDDMIDPSDITNELRDMRNQIVEDIDSKFYELARNFELDLDLG